LGRQDELSQLDPGSVLKSAHDFDSDSFKMINGITSVPSDYSEVALTYNAAGSVTNAKFWKSIKSEISEILTKNDVAASLNNRYFPLYSTDNNALYHVWYNVSGGGVDPSPINSTGIEIKIETNDNASIIALATALIINTFKDFSAKANNNKVRIENIELGETTSITDFDTGFTFSTVQNGTKDLIKSIDIPFSDDVRYVYNQEERKFEVEAGIDSSGNKKVFLVASTTSPTITNLSVPTANTEVDHTLQTNVKKIRIKNRDNGRLQFAFIDTESGTTYITIPPGGEYVEDGLNFALGTLSIQSNKASQTVEILEWV